MEDTILVADYIAEFLAEKKVKHVFFLPGGGAMYLNDAIAKSKFIKGIACLHEQACAIAAEAYSRINNNLGVAMVTTGPGATNAITGVAGAWIESVPMIIISGQVKRSDLLKNSKLRQKGVQEVDIVNLVKPITKYAKTIEQPEDIYSELESAFQLATTGRAGPVWIDVPLDIQASKIPRNKTTKQTIRQLDLSQQDANLYEKISGFIKNSKRPLILAGHGIRLSGAQDIFKFVVEKLNIPVVTTWNALDLLPYDHPLLVGRPGVVALRGPNFAVQNCDLLISIGSRLDNIITAYNSKGFAREAKKIIVDIDENELQKLDMCIDIKIESDAKTFLENISKLEFKQNDSWNKHCLNWKTKFSSEKTHQISSGKINHYHLVEELSNSIPENTLIATGSSGLAVEYFYTLFKNKKGQRVFLTSGLGSMGYGIPAAIGSCFSNNEQPMMLIESDGSLMLNLQELATIRAYHLPICIVVMNNAGFASIRNTQRNYFSSRYLGTGPEAGMWFPDLEKTAQSFEIPYMKITSPEDISEKLKTAIGTKKTIIVDVHLENNETLFPKVSAIPLGNGAMISMPLEDMSPLLSIEELKNEMLIPLSKESYKSRGIND
jgi:acetolactate synthase-1/2/3 large subunit